MDDSAQAALISGAGLAPTNSFEAAIYECLPPGQYTVVFSGVAGGFGVGLVEMYDVSGTGPVPTPTPASTASPSPYASPSPSPSGCIENFDGVIPPAFPPGWVAGGGWVISDVMPDTPPNDAFCPDQDGISDSVLDKMGVTILGADASLFSATNSTLNSVMESVG